MPSGFVRRNENKLENLLRDVNYKNRHFDGCEMMLLGAVFKASIWGEHIDRGGFSEL